MSRTRFLNESRQSEVCLFLATGCSLDGAARHVGCTAATVLRESKRNPAFAERVRISRRSAELSPINTMRRAAQDDWRAAAWLLERTQPEQFAKRAPKTFSQEEVATLLARACEVFRRETRDAAKYARIKRSVTVLARQVAVDSSIIDSEPAFNDSTPAELTSTRPAQRSVSNTQPPTADPATAHTIEQNKREWAGEMICLGDIKSRVATTYEAATAAD